MKIKNYIKLLMISNFTLLVINCLCIYASFKSFPNGVLGGTLLFTYLGTIIANDNELLKDRTIRFIPIINNFFELYYLFKFYKNVEEYINIIIDRFENAGVNDSEAMIKKMLKEQFLIYFDIYSFIKVDGIYLENKIFINEIINRLEEKGYNVFFMKTILKVDIFAVYLDLDEKYVFGYFFEGIKDRNIKKYLGE